MIGSKTGRGTEAIANGLGWFSIALGAAELLAPRATARTVGLERDARVVQAYGLREIASGVAILASGNPRPWLWARLAGDAIDVATLAPALRHDDGRRSRALIGIAAVLGVAVLDFLSARRMRALPPH
jgi:hypothetical protein